MTTTTIIGKLGSGKTLIQTILILNEKREIWSNYKINIPNYRKLEVYDLLDLKDNIVVLMDEGYSWIESRVSGSALNEHISSVIFHTRKSLTDIYTTTPMFSALDKRFRKMTNFLIECSYREPYSNQDFNFTFHNIDNYSYGKRTLSYGKAKKYFKYYNTFEKIKAHRKIALRFKILSKYPEKLKEVIIELSKYVRPELKKITHDTVKNSLLMNGIDLAFEPTIYIYLKGSEVKV